MFFDGGAEGAAAEGDGVRSDAHDHNGGVGLAGAAQNHGIAGSELAAAGRGAPAELAAPFEVGPFFEAAEKQALDNAERSAVGGIDRALERKFFRRLGSAWQENGLQ